MSEVIETKRYSVDVKRMAHDCGMCGPSGMTEIVVSDGKRSKTMRQSMCDNSDPLTAASALDWFIYGEDEDED